MDNNLNTIFLNALDKNKDKIFRICASFFTNKNDAKDTFQEVLFNIWKSLPSFKNQSSIDTWIYRITINICLKKRHFENSKQKLIVSLESIEIENVRDITNECQNNKKYYKLLECIKKLEGIEKSVILLYLEEVPYKNIAQTLGLSENYVAVKISRIKIKLLNCINSIKNDE